MKEMNGDDKAPPSNLQPLHIIAKGLTKRINGKVVFKEMSRYLNKASKELAKKAARLISPEGDFLFSTPI